MIIEARPAAAAGDHVLLIWGDPRDGLASLMTAMTDLASGPGTETLLSPGPGMTGVTVIGRRTAHDRGVHQIAAKRYVWELSALGWDNVAGLLEPFHAQDHGFQYLDASGMWVVIVAPDGRY